MGDRDAPPPQLPNWYREPHESANAFYKSSWDKHPVSWVFHFLGLWIAIISVALWRYDVWAVNHADLPSQPDIAALSFFGMGSILTLVLWFFEVPMSFFKETAYWFCTGVVPPFTWLITGLGTILVTFAAEQFSTYQAVVGDVLTWRTFFNERVLNANAADQPGFQTYAMNITSSQEEQASCAFLILSGLLWLWALAHYLMATWRVWRGDGRSGQERCYHVVFYTSFPVLASFYLSFGLATGFLFRWLAGNTYWFYETQLAQGLAVLLAFGAFCAIWVYLSPILTTVCQRGDSDKVSPEEMREEIDIVKAD